MNSPGFSAVLVWMFPLTPDQKSKTQTAGIGVAPGRSSYVKRLNQKNNRDDRKEFAISVLKKGTKMNKKPYFTILIAVFILFTVSLARAEAVLTITGAEVTTNFPVPGAPVSVDFVVQNIGNEQVPGRTSLGVDIYSSNEQGIRAAGDFVRPIGWHTYNIDELLPGRSQTITATAVLNKIGWHAAEAVLFSESISADKLRVVNPNFKKTFRINRPPDLVLENMRLSRQGRLSLLVFNGGGDIPDAQFQNSNIRVNVTGVGVRTIPLSSVAPATLKKAQQAGWLGLPPRYLFELPSTGSSGLIINPSVKNKIEVTLDYNQSINDSRRSNNTMKKNLGGTPDLVVCFKKSNHNKPHRNVWYPPYVKNIGYATSGSSKLRFWIENDGAKTYNIPQLAPGKEYHGINRRVYWVRVKIHKFRLTADFNKSIAEFDETNNIIEGSIIVGDYGNNSQTLCSDAPGMTGYK